MVTSQTGGRTDPIGQRLASAEKIIRTKWAHLATDSETILRLLATMLEEIDVGLTLSSSPGMCDWADGSAGKLLGVPDLSRAIRMDELIPLCREDGSPLSPGDNSAEVALHRGINYGPTILGVLQDATPIVWLQVTNGAIELKAGNVSRQLSEATFESIFHSRQSICVGQNKTAQETFGYTDEEAIGRYG